MSCPTTLIRQLTKNNTQKESIRNKEKTGGPKGSYRDDKTQ